MHTPTASFDLFSTPLFFVCMYIVANDSARLVEGNADSNGRVEVFVDNAWGTVCDQGWGLVGADILCQQLGFPRSAKIIGGAHFGKGSGSVLLSEVQCAGNEESLIHCAAKSGKSCSHEQDAGVFCSEGMHAQKEKQRGMSDRKKEKQCLVLSSD